MSAKVSVLEAHQDISDTPRRHVKRSVADLLVRRLLAKLISKRLIQMVSIRESIEIVAPAPKAVIVPKLNAPRKPDWLFTAYPIKDQRTCEYQGL
jgi:hypothetical protein